MAAGWEPAFGSFFTDCQVRAKHNTGNNDRIYLCIVHGDSFVFMCLTHKNESGGKPLLRDTLPELFSQALNRWSCQQKHGHIASFTLCKNRLALFQATFDFSPRRRQKIRELRRNARFLILQFHGMVCFIDRVRYFSKSNLGF